MGIPQQYKFRIAAPYIRTQADDTEIARDLANDAKWGDGYKNFKKSIRNHLKVSQTGRCAFCRCLVSIGTSYSNLEHIIAKSDYPTFAFLPINLVYCCTLCNLSKKKRNTINNPNPIFNQQQYPNTSNGFLIVNPYYDNYEDHIDFIDDILVTIINNSSKGLNTIEFYELSRPELAEERARELRLNKNNVHQQLLAKLSSGISDQQIIDQINDIIVQLPNWTV